MTLLKSINQGCFMLSSQINDLAKQYIELRKEFCAAVESSPLETSLFDKVEAIKEQLLVLLPYTIKVAKLNSGKYLLRQQGETAYVKLTPIVNPVTIAKFSMTLHRHIYEATKFATKEEADALVEGANFAMFDCFITEMKTKLSA